MLGRYICGGDRRDIIGVDWGPSPYKQAPFWRGTGKVERNMNIETKVVVTEEPSAYLRACRVGGRPRRPGVDVTVVQRVNYVRVELEREADNVRGSFHNVRVL